MKKIIMFVLLTIFLAFTVMLPQASAQTADGVHSLNYQVNQPNSNSASIANDYFLKPAKVTVKNGAASVQITLKNSAWITEFNPPGGASVISENKTDDKRVVQFTVKDLSQPVKVAMKIDVDDINYHHAYTVELVFDALPKEGAATTSSPTTTVDKTSSKTTTSGTVDKTSKKATTSSASTTVDKTTTSEEQEPNPQTGDTTPYLLILTLVGSAFLLYRNRMKTKQGEQK